MLAPNLMGKGKINLNENKIIATTVSIKYTANLHGTCDLGHSFISQYTKTFPFFYVIAAVTINNTKWMLKLQALKTTKGKLNLL